MEEYGHIGFDTGAELRRFAMGESELALQVRDILAAGHLVPTSVVVQVLSVFMEQNQGKPALFD